jgi:hypothetical protein
LAASQQKRDSKRGAGEMDQDPRDVKGRVPTYVPALDDVRANGARAEAEASAASGAASGRVLAAAPHLRRR